MKPPYSKVAIVHDVFIEFGGAERVLLEILAQYPDADIFIPLLAADKRALLRKYGTGKIQTSFLNYVPLIHSASILLKPMLFWYWQTLDLASYDLVITSSHSFSSKAVITGALTTHISYVHTPPRYLYVEYNETRILRSPIMRTLLAPLLTWLRSQDYLAAQRPDILVANSKTVARRISKYYRRTAELLYPPIRIPDELELKRAKRNWEQVVSTIIAKQHRPGLERVLRKNQYFVCFSRLAKQKGMDLAVKTCAKLHLPLLVVGQGSQEKYLKSLASNTTIFVGAVSDADKSALLANAAALIYCSIEEDFGMVTAESLAHGTPVIGYKSGGTTEIVTADTGILFNEFSVEALTSAIKRFNHSIFSQQSCRNRARVFAATKFRQSFQRLVNRAKVGGERTPLSNTARRLQS